MLRAWGTGDATALDRLTPIVYAELHRLARRNLAGEREGRLLQPSALVNEAFVRLFSMPPGGINSAVASEGRPGTRPYFGSTGPQRTRAAAAFGEPGEGDDGVGRADCRRIHSSPHMQCQ